MHATTEETWEAEFSVWSIPRLYNEEQWDKSVSHGQKSHGDTLVVSQQAQLVIGHGNGSRGISSLEAATKQQPVKKEEMRRLSVCYSDL
jgi:hypothetical protein